VIRLARRGAALAAAALALAALAGCAKKDSPSGGPPDVTPPRLVESSPDSAAAGVPLDVRPVLTFSEPMEPRSTSEAISIAPPVEIRQQRWSKRSVTLVFAKPLEPDHTYTMFVAGTARDRHGNTYDTGATVTFSTADSFPAGSLGGRIEARGFAVGGSYLWCYDVARGHEPDSTARDFDALGIADDDGNFQIVGLAVPGRYRLWVFVDLNYNRSLDPTIDVLAPVDTTFELTHEHPRAANLLLHVVNPRAPGRVEGVVVDSVTDSVGVLHVLAVADTDTTKQVLVEVDRERAFTLSLAAGTWRLRAFRDLDSNRIWDPEHERASDPLILTVEPAGVDREVRLRIRPRSGGP
jgi:uncharacterized protein (DUF2141 family)